MQHQRGPQRRSAKAPGRNATQTGPRPPPAGGRGPANAPGRRRPTEPTPIRTAASTARRGRRRGGPGGRARRRKARRSGGRATRGSPHRSRRRASRSGNAERSPPEAAGTRPQGGERRSRGGHRRGRPTGGQARRASPGRGRGTRPRAGIAERGEAEQGPTATTPHAQGGGDGGPAAHHRCEGSRASSPGGPRTGDGCPPNGAVCPAPGERDRRTGAGAGPGPGPCLQRAARAGTQGVPAMWRWATCRRLGAHGAELGVAVRSDCGSGARRSRAERL